MAYSAEISRANPQCIVILIDQSKAMLKPIGGSGRTRAEAAADAVNQWLYNLVLRCVWGASVLDRFHVGLYGYGASVGPAFPPPLAGRELVPIGELSRSPLRVEARPDPAGGPAAKFPIWVEPTGEGLAPLCAALSRAAGLVAGFLADYPSCYPPWVVNITSGESTDGDPTPGAVAVRSLSSHDGEALLFNLYLSGKAAVVEFPDTEAELPGEKGRRLFRLSSRLPDVLWGPARSEGIVASRLTRGLVLNGDITRLVRWLDIGTRVGARRQEEPARKPEPPRRPEPTPPPPPSTRAAPTAPDAALTPEALYDVRCRLGGKLKTYASVRVLGLAERATVPGGELFGPCLVLETPDRRKVYLPARSVVAVEERPRDDGLS